MDLFWDVKLEQNFSVKYIKTAYRCFFAPFRNSFGNCIINEVTPDEAHRYIYRRDTWNITSKNTHNRHLRTLYSFIIQKGHATLNPFATVAFAKDRNGDVSAKVISSENVGALLQYALDYGYKAECASMVLVFFCGVRVEEVERVRWDNIRLSGLKPVVDVRVGKNSRRRVNEIPPNAVEWLRLCRAEGPVAPQNYIKRMQRLRKKADIPYSQNAARHSFSSYHIAFHNDAPKTACLLGHPSPALLYSTYRELVSFEEAEAYWTIMPSAVVAACSERKEQERLSEINKRLQLDDDAKEEAEIASNVGRAIKIDGRWIPVIDKNFDPPVDWDDVSRAA